MWTARVAYFVISRYLIWGRGLLSCYSLDFCWIIYLVMSCGGLHYPLQIECWGYLEFFGILQLILTRMNFLKAAEEAEERSWENSPEFCVYFADYGFLFCWKDSAVTLMVAVRFLWLRYVLFPFLFSCFLSHALSIDLVSIHGDKILNILTILCWVSDLEKKEKKMKIVIGASKILNYFITGCNIVQVLRMWISV